MGKEVELGNGDIFWGLFAAVDLLVSSVRFFCERDREDWLGWGAKELSTNPTTGRTPLWRWYDGNAYLFPFQLLQSSLVCTFCFIYWMCSCTYVFRNLRMLQRFFLCACTKLFCLTSIPCIIYANLDSSCCRLMLSPWIVLNFLGETINSTAQVVSLQKPMLTVNDLTYWNLQSESCTFLNKLPCSNFAFLASPFSVQLQY